MTTLSSKKSSFAVAGNKNSITQAQQYSGICLCNELTVINKTPLPTEATVRILLGYESSIERGPESIMRWYSWPYLRE